MLTTGGTSLWLSGAEGLLMLLGIVTACAMFTNAIEWIGERFNLSEGAVGSLLAAVGTALPETLVPIIALVGAAMPGSTLSTQASNDIGIGAILGAPFMLATLAMGVSGLAVWIYSLMGKRSTQMNVPPGFLLRDLGFFFAAFLTAVAASLIPLPFTELRWAVGLGLLVLYGVYVKQLLSEPDTDGHQEESLEPLWLSQWLGALLPSQKNHPSTGLIITQTVLGLLGIIVLAHAFVEQIDHLSHQIGMNALILSLIIIPIATELPEKFNSVMWLGKEKDTLALGNITGAMVFQSCIPVAIGVCFTPWHLEGLAWWSVASCVAGAGTLAAWAYWGSNGLKNTQIKGLMAGLLVAGLAYGAFVWRVFI